MMTPTINPKGRRIRAVAVTYKNANGYLDEIGSSIRMFFVKTSPLQYWNVWACQVFVVIPIGMMASVAKEKQASNSDPLKGLLARAADYCKHKLVRNNGDYQDLSRHVCRF